MNLLALSALVLGIDSSLAFAPRQLRSINIRRNEPPSQSISITKTQLENDKTKGVYSRPSAAIERGSGFFVPGLEGPRVRLVVACGLLAATIGLWNGSFPLSIAFIYALLLLYQAALEYFKQQSIQIGNTSTTTNSTTTVTWQESWRVPVQDAPFQEAVQWVGRTLLSTLPATQFALFQNNILVYELGIDSTETRECDAIQDALRLSERVALPPQHPAAQLYGTRTTILQQIPNGAILVGTDSPSIPVDVAWVGQMAQYLELRM